MDSSNFELATNTRVNTGLIYDDQLDRCEQVKQIKARILQLEKNRTQTRIWKEKFLQNRQQRLKMSKDISLSISNIASVTLSTVKESRQLGGQINKYQSIASITQQQNNNLKQQNEYLLAKLKLMQEKEKKFRKIAEKAQKYKKLYLEATVQLEVTQEKCKAYKNKAEEMKRIALLDVGKLQDKIRPFVRSMDESYSDKSQVFTREESDNSLRMGGKNSMEI